MDLAGLLRTSPSAVLVVDPDGRLVWGNDAAGALLTGHGVPPEQGRSLLPLLLPRSRRRALALLARVAAGTSGGPVHLRLEGEREQWVAVRGVPTGDGTAQLAVVDVTAAVLARRRLRAREADLRATFAAGVTGMALLDRDGTYLRVNAALAHLLGRGVDELIGRSPDDVTHPDDRAASAEALQGRVDLLRRRTRYLRPDGEVRHGLMTTLRLRREPPLVFVQVEDVTDSHVHEERLRHLALHDGLTNLPGRPLVLSRLEDALSAPGAGVVAVLFVDLDGFKLVNDALGHAAGDRVLVEAAGRLRAVVRPGDTVGRFGGDEFLVVLPRLADREEGLRIARRIEQAVAAPFPFGEDEVLVGASVGVAFAEPDPTHPPAGDALVEDADMAMYRAKQLGRRRYEVFDSAMRERAAERQRVERLLARAVAEDRVVSWYQPVVELSTRRVVGLEALMRIRDDDGSLLLPCSFLDIALQNGLLPSLDDVVLVEAATQLAHWRATSGLDLELALNICGGQVTPELPGKVDGVLAAAGLPADRLVLELTEQTLVSSGPGAGRILSRLFDRGVRLSIDDFGTGWASLTYLRRFPVRQVKIDRSFVAGLPHERDDFAIVKAVVDLGKQLGLDCVAEGVETEEQHAALAALRPPYAQGYLFSPPVPAAEVAALLTPGC